MVIPGIHFCHILFYYFWKGKNAVQARKKLYDVYGEKSLIERQCQNWFAHFSSGDLHLKDAPRSGRPTEVDDDKIKAMIELSSVVRHERSQRSLTYHIHVLKDI